MFFFIRKNNPYYIQEKIVGFQINFIGSNLLIFIVLQSKIGRTGNKSSKNRGKI